jgi:ATP-dependent RNA helicase SUPV3L1/SUV3
MTSLTGASGEDFASILRSLGYRMDRKPKPVESAAPTAAAIPDMQTSPAIQVDPAGSNEVAAADVTSPESTESILTAEISPTPPATEFVAAETAPLVQDKAPVAVDEPAAGSAEETVSAAETVDAPAPVPETGATESKPPEEPAFVEVWRPAGRFERRPHRPRRQQRPQHVQVAASEPGAEPAAAQPEASSAAPEGAASSRPHRRHERGDRADREKRQDRHERQQRVERQDERVERQERSSRRDRPRRDRGERVERAEREQYYAKPFGSASGGRDKQPDPNSPFAKLAALKQQLEQSGKDPS